MRMLGGGRRGEAFNHFPEIRARLSPVVGDVVLSAAGQVVVVAAGSMEGQSSPSAPGDPPAIVSGILHDSLDSKMTGPTEAMAYTNVEYGPHLEFGTVHMEPRPFFARSAMLVDPSFQRAVKAALNKRLI